MPGDANFVLFPQITSEIHEKIQNKKYYGMCHLTLEKKSCACIMITNSKFLEPIIGLFHFRPVLVSMNK